MIISDKYKFIFIKVPRTSSTTIENHFIHLLDLANYVLDGRPDRLLAAEAWTDSDIKSPFHSFELKTHTNAKEAKKLIPKNIWDNYYKCAFIRNPWDWVASQFCWNFWMGPKYRHRVPSHGEFNGEGADQIIGLLRGNCANGEEIQNQHAFLHDEEGNLLVDFVGKFEDRNSGLKHILKTIGAPAESAGGHLLRTPNSDIDYQNFYTGEARRKVDKAFAKDITTLGYKF